MSEESEHSDELAKWLKGDLSDEERLLLEESAKLEDLKAVLNDIDDWSLPAVNIEKGLSALRRNRIEKKETKVVTMPFRTITSVAASIVLVIGIYFASDWFGRSERTIETALGEQVEYQLPDGSIVKLDALSSISYSTDWNSQRSVKLSGRAFFDVSKGGVFSVKTRQGKIQVLGTEFEVADFNDQFEVSCFEGKVQVQAKDQVAILTVSQKVSFENQTLVRSTIQNTEPDWVQGFSQFEKAPLPKVILELKKYYEVEIQLPTNLAAYQYTGRFPHHDLNLALRSIFDPLEIQFLLTEEGEVIFN